MGAYANPKPYAVPDLERSLLAGRIKVARSIAEGYRRSGDTVRAAKWSRNVDVLLEHYGAADDRAISEAMARS